jgi:hypothetical protein
MNLCPAPKGLPFEPFADQLLEQHFRNVWTDNADMMSLLYAGTPALKTDFTRTMKRTGKGAIADGINSITRYYINNFCDGYNHDCLDLWQKKLTPLTMLSNRSLITSFKLLCFSLISLIVVTHYFLHRFFPYAEAETAIIDPQRDLVVIEQNNSKTKLLH